MVCAYWQLTEVGATFRSLASELGSRPVRHRKKERIRAHLFVGVLACHGVQLLRRKLAQQGIHDSWATIRHKLGRWVRVTTRLRTVEGRLIENCQDTRPGAEAERIARAAGVEPRRHRKQVRGADAGFGRCTGPWCQHTLAVRRARLCASGARDRGKPHEQDPVRPHRMK